MSEIQREHKITIPQNILCWINTNINEINEDVYTEIEQLRRFVQSIYTFNDLDKCIDFIKLRTSTTYLILTEIVPQLYPICKFRVANPVPMVQWLLGS
jgi:hypothetical protein